ncbi:MULTISPECIES: TetR/AcrR family transcriptional regulator [Paenibacillus]|uniref:TetR/AcrR family transcriptional regulator n=1 Tax=Paenibacillus TaxID=44249 RepID=UPI0009704ACC|nr:MULTISPECIES: TetR/AcrR family transcriptional regulator [Paenibacillus]ASS67072.1 TetR/AcrR family transcriptional regulator [Paenibacillus sp. RUD330]
MNKLTLRELKKEVTAHALAEAAFELAVEHGLDGFVVDDIARRAGYSRRTFANYYTCKEEAVVMAAFAFKEKQEPMDLLEALPEGAHPLDVLYRLMTMRLTATLIRRLRTLVALSKRSPSLEPYILSLLRRLQLEAQTTLNDISRGRYPEGYSHLLAGALYGAVLPLIDGSLDVLLPDEPEPADSGAATFEHYLDTAFSYLRNGF